MIAYLRSSLVAIAVLSSGALFAAPIVDHSPDALGLTALAANPLQNQSNGQNFLVHFSLASATEIGGASIYSDCPKLDCDSTSIGTAVVTKIRADVGGAPDTVNLFEINSLITAIDSMGSSAEPSVRRIHTDFSSVTLAAGDYWIGISGAVVNIGWNVQIGGPSTGLWILFDDLAVYPSDVATAPFQVDGVIVPNDVPEPATAAMVAAAMVLMGGLRRRRNSIA